MCVDELAQYVGINQKCMATALRPHSAVALNDNRKRTASRAPAPPLWKENGPEVRRRVDSWAVANSLAYWPQNWRKEVGKLNQDV